MGKDEISPNKIPKGILAAIQNVP
ncbi:hypothetical protein TrispH2_004274 [Trichoplax sp. H2]|nr:hypothetical protein TrispH2_004274 [Trichoplax sp. H2]|eukprot:RDD43592.1 hypothetical protein TrispH2_004274 [Trichoplax sp. H2]